MKVNNIFISLLIAFSVIAFTGCEVDASGSSGYRSIGPMVSCETDSVLFYDKNTSIVYYIMSDYVGYWGYGFMSPYISENGYFCKYIDGEIVEVVKE